jgi:uncharacterized protein with HEPN domain
MKSDYELLMHIKDEMDFIISESKNINIEIFLKDETLKRAFARSLEIIGEAVKNVSNDMVISHPEIEWRSMAAMRDKLIHAYFSVDYSIVWDVAINKLPSLNEKVKNLLKDLKT